MKKEKTRVLLQAYHTERRPIEFHLGAAAIVISAIQIIKELLPNAEFVTYSKFSDSFSKQHGLMVLQKGTRVNNDFNFFTSLKSTWLLFCCIVWAFFRKYMHLNLDRILLRSVQLRAVYDADIIIDLSADHFGDLFGNISVLEISKQVLIAKLLGKPIMMCAQSIGPLKGKVISRIGRYILDKTDIITLRDEISKKYVEEIGVTKTPVYVTADPAFLMQPASRSRVFEILKKKGITEKDKPFIGICPSETEPLEEPWRKPSFSSRLIRSVYYWFEFIFPEGLFDILVTPLKNSKFFKKFARGSFVPKNNLESITQLINQINEKIDATVLVIPAFSIPSDRDDLKTMVYGQEISLAEEISKSVLNKDKVKLISGDYTAEEIKGVIGQCDLFVSMRLHACIGAVTQDVPAIPIAYDGKFKNIFSLAGQEKRVVNSLDLNELITKIEDTWMHREEIREELKAKVPAVKAASMRNAELVKELLSGVKK